MPLVTVLLATHDDARYLRAALESVLAQTLGDLELLVVDDASDDATAELLAELADRRVRVIRNDEQSGLAASLNRGLDVARGRYVARLDADDIADARRLERQLQALERSGAAVVGSAVREVDGEGRAGRVHRMPAGAPGVRWHALFSSPFFHPTVLVDRDVLERNGLRYDASFLESEDYDLWTRLLATGVEGGNVEAPLVLKRVHPAQASLRRADLQRKFQRTVALREIARIAPVVDAEAAWSFGIGLVRTRESARAYRDLLRAFEARHGRDREVRAAAAKRFVRARLPRRRPDPRGPGRPTRVTVVSPEPTPYRAPLFDRLARREDLELRVVYASGTVASRRWRVTPKHDSVTLRGVAVPGARRLLRHDYPVTPGVVAALRAARPDVVVVSGWSTFAAQVSLAWCRARGTPYVLLVESHDAGRRSAWRRLVKDVVVPPVVRGAAAWLAVGTLARESLVARGATPERVRIFANTIDVERWIARADELASRRTELRARLGVAPDEVMVLSVGRLVPEKGFGTLLAAAAPDVRVVLAGEGPLRAELERRGATLVGEVGEEALAELYAAADVFALLSTHEPWAVVVNEAAAAGLPLVLSDEVGAARDLLRAGENGVVVAPGDAAAAAEAIRRYADPDTRLRAGARSRELVRRWDYGSSVDAFVAAVRDATASR